MRHVFVVQFAGSEKELLPVMWHRTPGHLSYLQQVEPGYIAPVFFLYEYETFFPHAGV
jgi:hypothetical protein